MGDRNTLGAFGKFNCKNSPFWPVQIEAVCQSQVLGVHDHSSGRCLLGQLIISLLIGGKYKLGIFLRTGHCLIFANIAGSSALICFNG